MGAARVVTATSGATNIALAKSFGADLVIDYKVEDIFSAVLRIPPDPRSSEARLRDRIQMLEGRVRQMELESPERPGAKRDALDASFAAMAKRDAVDELEKAKQDLTDFLSRLSQ